MFRRKFPEVGRSVVEVRAEMIRARIKADCLAGIGPESAEVARIRRSLVQSLPPSNRDSWKSHKAGRIRPKWSRAGRTRANSARWGRSRPTLTTLAVRADMQHVSLHRGNLRKFRKDSETTSLQAVAHTLPPGPGTDLAEVSPIGPGSDATPTSARILNGRLSMGKSLRLSPRADAPPPPPPEGNPHRSSGHRAATNDTKGARARAPGNTCNTATAAGARASGADRAAPASASVIRAKVVVGGRGERADEERRFKLETLREAPAACCNAPTRDTMRVPED